MALTQELATVLALLGHSKYRLSAKRACHVGWPLWLNPFFPKFLQVRDHSCSAARIPANARERPYVGLLHILETNESIAALGFDLLGQSFSQPVKVRVLNIRRSAAFTKGFLNIGSTLREEDSLKEVTLLAVNLHELHC